MLNLTKYNEISYTFVFDFIRITKNIFQSIKHESQSVRDRTRSLQEFFLRKGDNLINFKV